MCIAEDYSGDYREDYGFYGQPAHTEMATLLSAIKELVVPSRHYLPLCFRNGQFFHQMKRPKCIVLWFAHIAVNQDFFAVPRYDKRCIP